MKALVFVSLIATIATSTFASTSTKTSVAIKVTDKNTKSLSLQEIAEKSQNTSSLLEQDNKTTPTNLSVDNSGRLNNKDEALKMSAENNKKSTIKK